MPPLTILIIGNSIAGSTLATFLLLLPGPKPHITLLERRSASSMQQGQNIDIRPEGLLIIRKLGLETVIRRSTTGEAGVQWVDDKSRIWFGIPAGPGNASPTSDIEIMRGRLAQILRDRSEDLSAAIESQNQRGIEYIYGDYLDELTQDEKKVHVRFAKSGKRRSFDLVVAGDGLQSATRGMVWGKEGEEQRVKRLGIYGAFFSIPRDEKKDSLWRDWFHTTGKRSIMKRPDVSRDRTTFFMTVANDSDARLLDLATGGHERIQAQKDLMASYFHNAGWDCERIIKGMRETEDFYFEILGQVKMDKWSLGRVVLLGDAAYCGSPLSGMGTTLALNGAYHLAGALSQHPGDHTAAFTQYEKQMRPLVDRAQKLPPGLLFLFGTETAWGLSILHCIMWLITASKIFVLLGAVFKKEPKTVSITDYGFRDLPELTEERPSKQ